MDFSAARFWQRGAELQGRGHGHRPSPPSDRFDQRCGEGFGWSVIGAALDQDFDGFALEEVGDGDGGACATRDERRGFRFPPYQDGGQRR